jgi:16S rRNA (cytosine1402-N4)-methyltransferase
MDIDRIHFPVMLPEALAGLAIDPAGFYVDCTFGRGGHSRAILDALGEHGRLLALDKDPDAVVSADARELAQDPRFEIEHASYAELRQQIEKRGQAGRVAGVLLDLGVSSPQLDRAERGFSFLRDGPLDMRMNTARGLSAAQWLDAVNEEELISVLREYGEERFAGRIARAVLAARPLQTTLELAKLIESVVPVREKHKHPATRSFQAIRMAVNNELDELELCLRQTLDVLQDKGRLVVISFHSLEDRIVKRFVRDEEKGAPVPRHMPVLVAHVPKLKKVGAARKASQAELDVNVRSRSAVLRAAERVFA